MTLVAVMRYKRLSSLYCCYYWGIEYILYYIDLQWESRNHACQLNSNESYFSQTKCSLFYYVRLCDGYVVIMMTRIMILSATRLASSVHYFGDGWMDGYDGWCGVVVHFGSMHIYRVGVESISSMHCFSLSFSLPLSLSLFLLS